MRTESKDNDTADSNVSPTTFFHWVRNSSSAIGSSYIKAKN
jgi:hypothetical protein